MQETWLQSMFWEDPLEKEMVIDSSILAWKTPWPEERDRLQSMELPRVKHDSATKPQQEEAYNTGAFVFLFIFKCCITVFIILMSEGFGVALDIPLEASYLPHLGITLQ